MIEFDYYKVRCNIAAEEVSDDLYRFCETPLKKKLISSSKIAQDIKFTDPEIMKTEIKMSNWVLEPTNKDKER